MDAITIFTTLAVVAGLHVLLSILTGWLLKSTQLGVILGFGPLLLLVVPLAVAVFRLITRIMQKDLIKKQTALQNLFEQVAKAQQAGVAAAARNINPTKKEELN
jgi:hypothetical protein